MYEHSTVHSERRGVLYRAYHHENVNDYHENDYVHDVNENHDYENIHDDHRWDRCVELKGR